jgi:DNA repair photolyase
MHTHLGGECSHKCSYCYVKNTRRGRLQKYRGPLRLIEDELNVKYGQGKTIFIEHMNDLFARDVPHIFIRRIAAHCMDYPANTYVFQTKNPERYSEIMNKLPKDIILGITMETNRYIPGISNAPIPEERYIAFRPFLYHPRYDVPLRKFITIEPILDFDVDILAARVKDIGPEFVNIGADSKGHGLPEPPWEKVQELIARIQGSGIEIREKHNLERLKG